MKRTYASLRNIDRPRPGETAVMAVARGAVDSVVGQIARVRSARPVCLIANHEPRADERTATDRLAHATGQIMGVNRMLRRSVQTEFADG
jgi:hypothetical protein